MCCFEASAGIFTAMPPSTAVALDHTRLVLVWLAEAVKSAMQARPRRLMSSFLRSKVTSGAASFLASSWPFILLSFGRAIKKERPSAVFWEDSVNTIKS